MEIKSILNGAAAGHGSVPKSTPGQRGQRFRLAESKLQHGKVTWNPESYRSERGRASTGWYMNNSVIPLVGTLQKCKYCILEYLALLNFS